jgi:hypothetical protein
MGFLSGYTKGNGRMQRTNHWYVALGNLYAPRQEHPISEIKPNE